MATLEHLLRDAVDGLEAAHRAPPLGTRTAGVLLLFDTRDAALPLLFMERTGHLRHHPGQIAFPGGGAEPADADIVTTALREATEEAGIPAAAVDVVGVLPPFLTAISDNWLTPVIGLQEGDIELHPDPFEVASLFHIDLATLMEAPHMVRTLTHKGEQRDVHYFDAAGHVVWGVTGAIVAELIRRIRVLGE